MALGDLSPDQARFVERVTAGTGLDPRVVTSWVGTESGWGIHKPGHNYLNIRASSSSFKNFRSTDEAADAAIGLVRGSSYYTGIVASAAQGPAAQIEAIGASKWGTEGGLLAKVFAGLTGVQVVDGVKSTPVDFKIPGWVPFVGGGNVDTPDIPTPGDVYGAVSGEIGKVAGAAVSQVLQGTLSLVFSTAAIGLIGLGLFKLTAKTATEAVKDVGGVVDNVTTAAALIPTPATRGAGFAAKAVKAL